MHELSIAKSLYQLAKRVALEHENLKLARISIELGPMSGVESLLLRSAFLQVTQQESEESIQLEIVEVPLRALCLRCSCLSTISDFAFVCSECGAKDLEVCQGDGIQVTSVDLCESSEAKNEMVEESDGHGENRGPSRKDEPTYARNV